MKAIRSNEGWFVSHFYYQIDRNRWESLDVEERAERRQRLVQLIDDFKAGENCQIHCYSIWGLKADLGFLLVDPDLQNLNRMQFELSVVLSPGVLKPASSFISMSEISEYMSQDRDYDRTLREKERLTPDSPIYQEKMGEFKKRMQVYINDRLYPQIPDHRLMCFYPMSKRRGDKENWYLLDFDSRKKYMAGHSITGRKFQPTVRQLVTGAIGLDDWEWGVTLFSDDPYYFKKILYEMRYDEASARFGEFGSFLIGIRFEPEGLLARVKL